MHYNFVHKLSGGEKRRLKLLRVLMSNPNFLILDEPTNDLDIFAMSVLEEYLRNFQGCLIVVSHDRYFMDKMVDHLFVFEGEGKVRDIVGNYTDFRKDQTNQKRENKNLAAVEVKEAKVEIVTKESEKRKLTFKEKQEYEQIEKDLEKLESEKNTITEELSQGTKSNQEVYELGIKLGKIVQDIEQKTERWMELAEFA
jgi:ATP-binding cassette subfamily F protein uup